MKITMQDTPSIEPLEPGIYPAMLEEVDESNLSEFFMRFPEPSAQTYEEQKPYVTLTFSVLHNNKLRKLMRRLYIIPTKTGWLVKQLMSALGKKYPNNQQNFDFDLDELKAYIGQVLRLRVKNVNRNGKTYTDIDLFIPIKPEEGYQVMQQIQAVKSQSNDVNASDPDMQNVEQTPATEIPF